MRYIAAALIAAFVAVECLPRPDGLSSPTLSAPTSLDGQDSVQSGVNVDDNGEVQVRQSKKTTSESNQENAQSSAQGYDHTGPNGESVSQSSEKNTSHSESEKTEENETKAVSVGQGGLAMSEDRSTTSDRREENSESGRQSYKQSSGGDPNHKHSVESGSEYKNSNQTRDRRHDESHDKFAVGPNLETSSEHRESSSDQHDENQKAEGSSYMKKEDYDKDGKKTRRSSSTSQNAYKNEAGKSTSTSTTKEENKSKKNNGESNGDGNTNSESGGEAGGGINDGISGGTDAGTDAGADAKTDAGANTGTGAGIDAETEGGTDTQSNDGLDAGTDGGTSNRRKGGYVIDDKNGQTGQGDEGAQMQVESDAGAQTDGDEGQTNVIGDIGGQTDVRIDQTIKSDTDGQTNAGVETGDRTVQTGQTIKGNTDSQINAGIETGGQTGQTIQSDTEDQTNAGIETGSQTVQQGQRIQADTESQINEGIEIESQMTQKSQTNGGGNVGGQINGGADIEGQTDVNGSTKEQIGVRGGNNGGGEMGIDTGSNVDANTGRRFRVNKDVHRQLELNDRLLGLSQEGSDSSAASIGMQSNRDFNKVRKDYLLAVAQSIHNARVVSDGKGHVRFVSPNRYNAKPRYSSPGSLDLISPYRTLAQKYGPSPVSSHYANAQFVESNFGDLPSLLGFRDYEKLQNTGSLHGAGKLEHIAGKSHGFRNLFERADSVKYGHTENLHLSPLEWEERARKKADLRKALLINRESKFLQKDKIHPLVKNVILSQNLDDILEGAQTPAEVSSAMKTAIGKTEKFFTVPTNKQKEITMNKNALDTSSYKNEIFGRNKDKILGKFNFEVSKTYDAPKDISQVIINKVHLDSFDNGFDNSVISGNIMDNTLDHSGFAHLGDIEGRENKVVYDSSNYPRNRIIADRQNVVDSFKYVNMENSYSTPKVESDTTESSSSSSSFDSKLNWGNEEITTEDSGNKYLKGFNNSTETNTEKSSEISSDTTKTKVNFSNNDTTTVDDNLDTQHDTNKTVESNSSETNYNNIASDANSTDYIAQTQLLSSIDEFVTESSVNTTSQVLFDDETESKRKIEVEKINDDINKKIGALNLNSRNSANESEIISVDNVTLNTSNANLNITSDADKFNEEKTTETNEFNITASQDVHKEFENYEVSKSNEANKTNSNIMELFENSLSTTTQSIDKAEFNNKNTPTVYESYTGKSDAAELEESVTYIPEIKTKEMSENYSTEKSVDLNKRGLETNIFADNDSVIVDSSNFQPELNIKSDVQFEDSSNVTVLTDNPVADTVTESTDLTLVTDNDKLAYIDSNNNTSSISTKMSDIYINSSDNSNFDTTVVDTSTTTKNINETTVTDKVSGDSEGSERLFARSALESNEEYNIEDTTSIDNSTYNTSVADLDKLVLIPTLNSSIYDASEVTVKNETDITKVTLNSTDIKNIDSNTTNSGDISIAEKGTNITKVAINPTDATDSFERPKKDLTALVEEPNLDANISDSQPFVNVAVDTTNITDVKTTDSSNSTINTTSTIDINTDINLNEQVTVEKETNITKGSVNSIDTTDSLERTRKDLNALVGEPNSDANISDSQPFDNVEVDTANITDVIATDLSNSTFNTSPSIDTNKELNLNKYVTTDSTIQDVMTIATNDEVNDSKIKPDAKSETIITSDTSADLNITNIAPGGDKTLDSNTAEKKTDESNISGKETVKPELNIDNLTSDAGSSNNTTITAANSTNTTNISTVNEATENRPMDDNDKTGEFLTIVQTNDSQTSVKPDKSQTTDKPEPTVENGKLQATAKSENSQATIQTTGTAKSDKPPKAKSDKPKKMKSDKPQKVKSDKPQKVKSDKPQKAKSDKPQKTTDKSQTVVKSDKEKEESKKNKDDSTSKSDESSRSSSSERLLFNTDYSASTSSE